MNAFLGSRFLELSVLIAVAALFAAAVGGTLNMDRALQLARRLLIGFFALISATALMLLIALVDSDFRIEYVVSYTERALPSAYKLAAFWAGKEGSLLLWAWLLGAMNVIALIQRRGRRGTEEAIFLAVLAAVSGFFAALILYGADPFATRLEAATDGHGLNPLLQDPGMIAHPPILFLGYAGFTIPFAAMVAALAAGRGDDEWLTLSRRWLLFAWLALGVGILLGAQWAYIELGWGGYWAWDPVENASLLPWLTATALLHSMTGQQQRGTFKSWNVMLTAASFVLCILATYLTRSGVVQSVHVFAGSPISDRFFLAMMSVVLIITVALLIWRRRLLRSEQPLEHLISKEGALLATNVLLVLMAAITLVGTIFPLLSTPVIGEAITVKQPFYNYTVLPLGLVLLALMAFGPTLVYGREAMARLKQSLLLPAGATMLALVVLAAVALYNGWDGAVMLWTLAGTGVAVLTVSVMAVELWNAMRRRQRNVGGTSIGALVHVIDGNHRRYGGQLAHLGMILFMVGVLGSGLFGTTQTLRLQPGESAGFGPYTLTLQGMEEVREGHYTAVQAEVVLTGDGRQPMELQPQVRYYDKSRQPHTEVAWRTGLDRDVYLTLAGWEEGGRLVALEARLNPLVAWLWIGGVVLSLGGLFSLLPRLRPRKLAAPQSQSTAPAPFATASARQ
ncbi:MAG: heme lyase CcmF/NrfE family subunit [bacterium]